jgi:hypothetical protein
LFDELNNQNEIDNFFYFLNGKINITKKELYFLDNLIDKEIQKINKLNDDNLIQYYNYLCNINYDNGTLLKKQFLLSNKVVDRKLKIEDMQQLLSSKTQAMLYTFLNLSKLQNIYLKPTYELINSLIINQQVNLNDDLIDNFIKLSPSNNEILFLEYYRKEVKGLKLNSLEHFQSLLNLIEKNRSQNDYFKNYPIMNIIIMYILTMIDQLFLNITIKEKNKLKYKDAELLKNHSKDIKKNFESIKNHIIYLYSQLSTLNTNIEDKIEFEEDKLKDYTVEKLKYLFSNTENLNESTFVGEIIQEYSKYDLINQYLKSKYRITINEFNISNILSNAEKEIINVLFKIIESKEYNLFQVSAGFDSKTYADLISRDGLFIEFKKSNLEIETELSKKLITSINKRHKLFYYIYKLVFNLPKFQLKDDELLSKELKTKLNTIINIMVQISNSIYNTHCNNKEAMINCYQQFNDDLNIKNILSANRHYLCFQENKKIKAIGYFHYYLGDYECKNTVILNNGYDFSKETKILPKMNIDFFEYLNAIIKLGYTLDNTEVLLKGTPGYMGSDSMKMNNKTISIIGNELKEIEQEKEHNLIIQKERQVMEKEKQMQQKI